MIGRIRIATPSERRQTALRQEQIEANTRKMEEQLARKQVRDEASHLTPEERVFLQKATRKPRKLSEPRMRAADPGLAMRLDMAEIIKGLRQEATAVRSEVRKLQKRVYTLEQQAGINPRLRRSRK